MKRIPDEEIGRVLKTVSERKPKNGMMAIDIYDNERAVAQAQLEADQAQIPAIERAAIKEFWLNFRGKLEGLSEVYDWSKGGIRTYRLRVEALIKVTESELLGKGGK